MHDLTRQRDVNQHLLMCLEVTAYQELAQHYVKTVYWVEEEMKWARQAFEAGWDAVSSELDLIHYALWAFLENAKSPAEIEKRKADFATGWQTGKAWRESGGRVVVAELPWMKDKQNG